MDASAINYDTDSVDSTNSLTANKGSPYLSAAGKPLYLRSVPRKTSLPPAAYRGKPPYPCGAARRKPPYLCAAGKPLYLRGVPRKTSLPSAACRGNPPYPCGAARKNPP